MICASACCRGIYFNKSPTNTDLQSSTQGGLLCLRPPPKKSKISLPTCHRWERAHARTAPFPKNSSGILFRLVRALSLKEKPSSIMFATQSLTKQFNSTATTTSSLTRKQQKQYRRRAGNQITRASSANVEKPKDSPPPTSSATATNPPNPPKKEDRKIVNGQDVPSFEDISTAHFRISSGTFPLSLPFSLVSVDERFGGYQFSFSSKWVPLISPLLLFLFFLD